MADGSGIQWTNATWNIVTGCSVKSAGCKNCYAMKLAGGRLRHIPSREGLTVETKNGPVWNGEVRFNAEWLDQPLRWKRPRRIFVCAHGDLFHENVPPDWIDRVFSVMAVAKQHQFQVLTKRSDRMRDYLRRRAGRGGGAFCRVRDDRNLGRVECKMHWDMPLPNVWLGVSVENQETADERIPDLMETPAAIRWISLEPALRPVDLSAWVPSVTVPNCRHIDQPEMRALFFAAARDIRHERHPERPGLDWIVAGGESGPNARPGVDANHYRALRDLSAAGMVPFFFKQWGRWWIAESAPDANRHGLPLVFPDGETFEVCSDATDIILSGAQDHRGAPLRLWRQYYASGDGRLMRKAQAGDALPLLDGVRHGAFPA